MPRLIVVSQIVENYGSPDEPYWKFKGTDEYVYSGIQEDEMYKDHPHVYGKVIVQICGG
jgi:hypothetical protein